MSGFRSRDRPAGRILIANLAHEDDIGVLSQSVLESIGKRVDVSSYLTLGHQRMRVGTESVLDRFFQREDSFTASIVHPVQDHGKGGRLSRSCHAGNQH